MRAAVIVSRDPRQAAERYEITVVQANGKPLKGLKGGTADEAAARAAMYAASHFLQNPAGGDVVAPKKIMDLIPLTLQHVK